MASRVGVQVELTVRVSIERQDLMKSKDISEIDLVTHTC